VFWGRVQRNHRHLQKQYPSGTTEKGNPDLMNTSNIRGLDRTTSITGGSTSSITSGSSEETRTLSRTESSRVGRTVGLNERIRNQH
jgi:hypothetical protein